MTLLLADVVIIITNPKAFGISNLHSNEIKNILNSKQEITTARMAPTRIHPTVTLRTSNKTPTSTFASTYESHDLQYSQHETHLELVTLSNVMKRNLKGVGVSPNRDVGKTSNAMPTKLMYTPVNSAS